MCHLTRIYRRSANLNGSLIFGVANYIFLGTHRARSRNEGYVEIWRTRNYSLYASLDLSSHSRSFRTSKFLGKLDGGATKCMCSDIVVLSCLSLFL